MTVLSWNVMSTGSPKEKERRGGHLLRVVEDSDADVLLLQEVWEGLAARIADSTGMSVAAEAFYGPDGTASCAVLTAEPLRPRVSGSLSLPGSEAGHDYTAASAEVDVDGRRWGLVSAHLPWGGRSEPARTSAVTELDRWVTSRLPDESFPVLLGADMNCTPQHSAWRILTGHQVAESGEGVLWADSWEACGEGEGCTTGPGVAPLSTATAKSVGSSRPDLEPARRIDGVFCRGWCYGRRGGPVSAEVLRTRSAVHASDHLPLRVEVLR